MTRYLTGRGEESAYSANLRASGGIQGALDGWLPAVGCRLPSLRRREPPGVSQNPATWEMMATCWRSFQKPSPNSLRCGPAVLQLLRAYLIFVLSRFLAFPPINVLRPSSIGGAPFLLERAESQYGTGTLPLACLFQVPCFLHGNTALWQVLNTAHTMLKAIQAKIQAKMTNKPLGAEDADLDKLRCVCCS